MSDLISRQAAINAIENTDCELLPKDWDELTDAIVTLPSANRPTGKWIMKHDGIIFKRTWGVCSCCGNTLDFAGLNAGRGDANYCPNCGAKMKGGTE